MVATVRLTVGLVGRTGVPTWGEGAVELAADGATAGGLAVVGAADGAQPMASQLAATAQHSARGRDGPQFIAPLGRRCPDSMSRSIPRPAILHAGVVISRKPANRPSAAV